MEILISFGIAILVFLAVIGVIILLGCIADLGPDAFFGFLALIMLTLIVHAIRGFK